MKLQSCFESSDLYKGARVGLPEHVARVLHQTVDVRRLLSPAVDQLRQTVALALLLVLEVRQEELSFDLDLVHEAVALLVDDRSPLVDASLTVTQCRRMQYGT